MEAKREALLAKTLRRREQLEQKAGEIEAKNAERRQAELEKQEAAEQRKREREAQRLKYLLAGSHTSRVKYASKKSVFTVTSKMSDHLIVVRHQ